MSNERSWNEMLDELRALGGAAENICLRQGPLGRGLFSIDPAKPVHLHIPKNLLIPCEDMVLERGALRVGPGANVGPRERAFLDGYQSKLGWGDGGGAEIARMFEMARTLPAELRHELLTQHRCGSWFEEPTDELMRELYLGARCITFEQRTTVMPFIELANHGETTEFVFRDGIALEGMFSGEVLASYSPLDSYGFFLGWGFVTEQPIALSIDLSGHIGASPLHVERIFKPSPETQRAWLPRLSTDRGEPVVDFLMIGNRRYPRLAKGIFYRLMGDAGFSSVEEAFDMIHHVNQQHFLDLISALEGYDQPLVRMLRKMALCQLKAMSFCYGVRAI